MIENTADIVKENPIKKIKIINKIEEKAKKSNIYNRR